MKVLKLELGSYGTNCYFAINEEEKRAVIIDPGSDARSIIAAIKKEDVKVEAILLTHGHSDHIGALEEVAKETDAKVFISAKDAGMLKDAKKNLSAYMGSNITFSDAEDSLKDGDVLHLAGLEFEVLATPGHTPGGLCFKCEDFVFCGDTIFCESIGRTDFPGGSYPQILESIQKKILTLPDHTKLLPGHGPTTDVGWERRMNPFLQ